MTGGSVGNIRRGNGINLAHGLQNAGQFAALIASVRRQQQPAFGRRRVGESCHNSSLAGGDDRQQDYLIRHSPGLTGIMNACVLSTAQIEPMFGVYWRAGGLTRESQASGRLAPTPDRYERLIAGVARVLKSGEKSWPTWLAFEPQYWM